MDWYASSNNVWSLDLCVVIYSRNVDFNVRFKSDQQISE